VVTVDDGSDTCVLRFFSFYPSQQKALAVGTRIRARGELKGGFLGWQMVHPTCRVADGDLPEALTPVYPTSASLPQSYLRKAVLGGLKRAELSDTLPPGFAQEIGLEPEWDLRRSLAFLLPRWTPFGPSLSRLFDQLRASGTCRCTNGCSPLCPSS
jgi:ATP-dependent DNA helicase RecG